MPMEGRANSQPRKGEATSRPSAHLVGVCGAGMKALAELLDGQGWRLSGSDLLSPGPAIQKLCDRGMTFSQGHHSTNLPVEVDCLIYSPAIPASNPERLEASRRTIPQWSYSQMVGRLMAARTGICVAGTHGKSTTTALVGWIHEAAGLNPAVLVGAESCHDGHSGHAGAGGPMVVESCEFNRSFLDFLPRHAAILNIEADHFDCFADLPALVEAFRAFARRVPADGVLVANADCESTLEAIQGSPARIVTFGIGRSAAWRAGNSIESPQGVSFEIETRGTTWGRIQLRLHGLHNIQNALAATALCEETGIPRGSITAALETFAGIRRRFEVLGEWKGLTRIDDYAHHPTAVRVSLQTCRQVYGDRRIWCVFQPHQVSRTIALMDDFAESFSAASDVLIVPVFAAREQVTNEPELVSRELAERIASRGVRARFVESLDLINSTVDDAARPGDVLIAMGAGDIDRIHHEFTRRFF